ncbi:hypothetical protein GGD63_004702 [Bradyrhizobium sp. cir1]|uniref:DUF5695 domain-containing protein n=1 Tax=Bradyrhizobium sp. cir1 TaxID=1445730 RepID=UPI0017B55204|nr:DUF5695 domain-containing protein [Bradyrhizobium sp. cir1]MBB4371901.1 hypothetical protein [Bradyrhizobium sp. cir1]
MTKINGMSKACTYTRRAMLLGSSGALFGGVYGAYTQSAAAQGAMVLKAADSPFVVGCTQDGITSLRYRNDAYDTDYVRPGAVLGKAHARVRRAGSEWHTLRTGVDATKPMHSAALELAARDAGVLLTTRLAVDEAGLTWEVMLRNDGMASVEVGDLFLPMPMNTEFPAGQPVSAAVLKHSFVSGHGSHIFWIRGNSTGPYLMLLPEADTSLEYWDVHKDSTEASGTWCAYILGGAAACEAMAGGTRWRQPTHSLSLSPGEQRRYRLRFQWVTDYEAARRAIADAGLVDVEVMPGMTVPNDLHVDIALASSIPVERIEAEFTGDTLVQRLPDRAGRRLWRVRFSRLGENRLTLHQPGARQTFLEFFATEPVETMMKKRATFIVKRQHRDPSKWYDGLFGEWNMDTQVLLGPDNYDRIKGWRIYEVTCDDPGLSKPAYLATKNAEHPDVAEVAALDRYIDTFVWGGLQRTTQEAYAYGLYGIPDWKQNRESSDPGPKGRLHIWRPYDYPHIFAIYLAMHRIARDHPAIPTRQSARDYLVRAYGTALAMFTVPMRVVMWSAYGTGFCNEVVIPELVSALTTAGLTREAATLEAHWARKVRAFVDAKADLFKSEYPFDSTAFESTQALARSALDDPVAMGVWKAAARAFAERQIAANLFCRGWLEPAYYYLGSDYRSTAGDAYTLTYMAQMGGWALLDHALNDADDPHPLVRLGYASQLSAWALLNSGPASAGHGYWYPGEENDGAAGGGFEPAPSGTTWLGQPHHRGTWYYSCEIDLGFCGAVRAAATIVADDPIFGQVCYGGTMETFAHTLRIWPRDGVRRRLNLRLQSLRLDLVLLDARFRADRPIILNLGEGRISLTPEPFAPSASGVTLELRYDDGRKRKEVIDITDSQIIVRLPAARLPRVHVR